MPTLPVIVLGAGASHDASSGFVAEPPPLVKHLFSSGGREGEVLRKYPLAEMAASEVRDAANREGEKFDLEAFLRKRYRDSPHEHYKRGFFQIPLYLQHRLLVASDEDKGVPDHYDRLIQRALTLKEVVFVSLNYDVLLDQRLSNYSPLTTLDAYLDRGRGWSLIKLHGSVNWGRRMQISVPHGREAIDPYLTRTFDDKREAGLDEISMRPVDPRSPGSLTKARIEVPDVFYPALSAPLGPADVVSCPEEHVEFFEKKLREAEGVHLLFIGYSGHDVEVMELLKRARTNVVSLTTVDRVEREGRGHADGEIRAQFARYDPSGPPRPPAGEAFTDGFAAFAQGELEQVLDSWK